MRFIGRSNELNDIKEILCNDLQQKLVFMEEEELEKHI